MTRKITHILIQFNDGTEIHVTNYELDRIQELMKAIDMLQLAKATYEQLQKLFESKM